MALMGYSDMLSYINVRLHKAADQPQKALEDFILLQMESLRCLAHGNVDKVSVKIFYDCMTYSTKVTMCFNMEGMRIYRKV